MNTNSSLFWHELRSVLRDRWCRLAVGMALPLIGAADYLMAARAVAAGEPETKFGSLAGYTLLYPAAVMVVAYRLFKDIDPNNPTTLRRAWPTPVRIWAGARGAILAAGLILWPTAVVGIVAALTQPGTVLGQILTVLPVLSLATGLGAFIAVRQGSVRASMGHAALLAGGFILSAVCIGSHRPQPGVNAVLNAQIVMGMIAVVAWVWALYVARRGPSRRRLAGELIVAMSIVPFIGFFPSETLWPGTPGIKNSGEIRRLAEVTGDLRLVRDNGKTTSRYNDLSFVNRSADEAELPKVTTGPGGSQTECEWRLISPNGTTTAWESAQSESGMGVVRDDIPIVAIYLPADDVNEALVLGKTTGIDAAMATRWTPGRGIVLVKIPDAMATPGRKPLTAAKDYYGKILEVRGKVTGRAAELREVLRTRAVARQRVEVSPGAFCSLEIRKENPATNRAETHAKLAQARLHPWIRPAPDRGIAQYSLDIRALSGGKICLRENNAGSSWGSNGLLYSLEIEKSFPDKDPVTKALQVADTFVLVKTTDGEAFEVPFHFRITLDPPETKR